MVQGLALLPHSKKVAGSRPPWSWVWDLSVWSLHVLPVVWVFTRFSSFLPHSKNMLRLIGDSKLLMCVIVALTEVDEFYRLIALERFPASFNF